MKRYPIQPKHNPSLSISIPCTGAAPVAHSASLAHGDGCQNTFVFIHMRGTYEPVVSSAFQFDCAAAEVVGFVKSIVFGSEVELVVG
jgi:hypothetical protein